MMCKHHVQAEAVQGAVFIIHSRSATGGKVGGERELNNNNNIRCIFRGACPLGRRVQRHVSLRFISIISLLQRVFSSTSVLWVCVCVWCAHQQDGNIKVKLMLMSVFTAAGLVFQVKLARHKSAWKFLTFCRFHFSISLTTSLPSSSSRAAGAELFT